MKVIIDFGNDGFKVEAFCKLDGDRWCVCAGNFAEMPAGFGGTIQQAIEDYKSNVRNQQPPVIKRKG